ncbi:MAG TPA: sulfite exporter TauE/SafE family protein [candidate division Zixibacteria bacterium]|nr:sulfite exporter TauE/SafE family protein [candidate division Zixibacteria bacterium]
MESIFLAIGTALWLGVLTSVSPCPLATNIAAISYIGKRVSSPRMVVMSGILYMLGRMIAYLGLGILLVASAMSVPELAWFLQKNMNQFLGPLLVIVGILLLGLVKFSLPGGGISQKMQNRVEKLGIWGAGLLGILFALSFCPVSAALFFGSLIPLSVKHSSSYMLPSIYGIGTALPVIIFAFMIGFGTHYLSQVFKQVTTIELWARKITGVIFILVGIYYMLVYILKLPLI